jgi:hypothetical protein
MPESFPPKPNKPYGSVPLQQWLMENALRVNSLRNSVLPAPP